MSMFAGTAVVVATSCAPPDAPPEAPHLLSSPSPGFQTETRGLLEELIAVDTSHGGETKALGPIADRLKAAGALPTLVESSPGRGNLIARLKGNGTKKPLLLVAHIDVVPVEGQPWTVPPFRPTEKDGFLWGRGVGDDKSMAAAFTATFLELARARTPLSRDVILALTAGEETGGSGGVGWLVANRRELVDAEIALNEGGALLAKDDMSELQMVGLSVAEKTFQSFRLVVKGGGGHSAMPKVGDDPVLELARALVKIGELRFPARVLPEVKGYFAAASTWEKAPLADALKRAAASAPLLSPEDEKILALDRQYHAQVETTCITTMLKGSTQDNVLPTSAEAIVNCRIMPDETREGAMATLVRTIEDSKVAVTFDADFTSGPASPATGEVPSTVAAVAKSAFPHAALVTTMTAGTTDSRYLRSIGVKAYGLSAAPTSVEEVRTGHTAHGADERRATKWLAPGAEYLRNVVLALAR